MDRIGLPPSLERALFEVDMYIYVCVDNIGFKTLHCCCWKTCSTCCIDIGICRTHVVICYPLIMCNIFFMLNVVIYHTPNMCCKSQIFGFSRDTIVFLSCNIHNDSGWPDSLQPCDFIKCCCLLTVCWSKNHYWVHALVLR